MLLFEKIEHLRLKLVPDWKVVFNGDPWTRFQDKTIFMAVYESEKDTLQLFLHEICHALRGKGGHGEDFWQDLEDLIFKHTNEKLNQSQTKMKQDYLNAKEFFT